ncbi:MAG TPA: hypothetical protein VKG82_05210 [Solirubrobacteraceae bacterium]|nr:hypothetical protein [Solirubrobacteraceae bacterium]
MAAISMQGGGVRAVLGALAAGSLALAIALAPVSGAAAATRRITAAQRSLLSSSELWATIDVCDPPDQPNTLGVRGSMPGDGQARDRMYMSFRLQYWDATSKRWVDLAIDTHAGYVAVGDGGSSRQDGSSFQINPVAGRPAFLMRGVVEFQWRRGRTVLLSVSRAATAGRKSLAGADPVGFSAASCSIG